MPPKKASAGPTATIPKDSDDETTDTKTGLFCETLKCFNWTYFEMTFLPTYDWFKDASESSSGKDAGRKVSPHPSTMEMVKEALKELDSKKGVSTQAIRGYIKEKYKTVDETRLKFMVRRALNKGLETGVFVRPANSASTTTGAQGRFRVTWTLFLTPFYKSLLGISI